MDFLSTSSAVAGHIVLQTVVAAAELLKCSVGDPDAMHAGVWGALSCALVGLGKKAGYSLGCASWV